MIESPNWSQIQAQAMAQHSRDTITKPIANIPVADAEAFVRDPYSLTGAFILVGASERHLDAVSQLLPSLTESLRFAVIDGEPLPSFLPSDLQLPALVSVHHNKADVKEPLEVLCFKF